MSNFFRTDHASPEQVERINRQVLADPNVQRILGEWTRRFGQSGFSGARGVAPLQGELLKAMRAAGLPENMRITLGANGQPAIVDDGGVNWGNIVALGIGGLAGGYALAGATGGAGPTTAGFNAAGTGATSGGYAAGTGAAAGNSLGGGLAAAGTTGGSMAGGLTAANVLRYGAPIAGELAGQWYAQRQADKARGVEVEMSREALELERQMFEKDLAYRQSQDDEDKRRYEQNRTDQRGDIERDYADMRPYRSIGLGALDRLAFGVGIPGKPSEQRTMPTNPTAATAPTATPMQPWNADTMGPVPTLASLGTPQAANVSGGGMTTMRTPTGQTVLVPAAKVQEAIANGGTVLQGVGA